VKILVFGSVYTRIKKPEHLVKAILSVLIG